MKINNRFKNIIKSDKPVLVDFYADWCQPCKEIQPVLKEVKNTFKENIRIVKVNVDRNPYIASQFKVKNIPTLILFRAGSIKWSNEGRVENPELTVILKKFII